MNSAILVLRKRSGEDGVKQAVAEKGYSGTHNIRKSGRKEPVMAYKKPQMVAKSESKKSYVAGCPENPKPARSLCSPELGSRVLQTIFHEKIVTCVNSLSKAELPGGDMR